MMDLQAIAPGPHPFKRCKDHGVSPYLLRDLDILQASQMWSIDYHLFNIPTNSPTILKLLSLISSSLIIISP